MGWMPSVLRSALARLWQSSADAAPKQQPKSEVHLVESGRLKYGAELYDEIAADDRKKRLADQAEEARKTWERPNLG
jgi:hypothetical protein